MKKTTVLFKNQLQRGLRGRGFRLSLILSTLFVAAQTLQSYTPIWSMDVHMVQLYPNSLFKRWLGGECYSFAGQLVYILLPLLCALPCQTQLFLDRKRGYLQKIALFCTRKELGNGYFCANFAASFLAAVYPFALSLAVCAVLYPALPPIAGMGFLPSSSAALMTDLFCTHPLIYCLVYILMIGTYQAVLSCLAMACSFRMQNPFLVLVCSLGGYFLFNFAMEQLNRPRWCPLYFLQPTQPDYASWPVYWVQLLIMLVTARIVLKKQVNRCEIF